MSHKPSAWINISSTGGALATHESLTTVLKYTGANVIEAACARIPVPRTALGTNGLIEDLALREDIAAAVTTLLDAVVECSGAPRWGSNNTPQVRCVPSIGAIPSR